MKYLRFENDEQADAAKRLFSTATNAFWCNRTAIRNTESETVEYWMMSAKEYERLSKIKDAFAIGGFTGESVLMHVPKDKVESIQTFLTLSKNEPEKDSKYDLEFEQKGQSIRQLALQGKWKPRNDQSDFYYYCLNWDKPEITKYPWRYDVPKSWGDYTVFFPDESTAKEYLLIEKGEWLPKGGDMYWCIRKGGGNGSSGICASFDFVEKARCGEHYFPSEEQRHTFIEKQKEKSEPNSDAIDALKMAFEGVAVQNCGRVNEKHQELRVTKQIAKMIIKLFPDAFYSGSLVAEPCVLRATEFVYLKIPTDQFTKLEYIARAIF